jgi:hypothetical protein
MKRSEMIDLMADELADPEVNGKHGNETEEATFKRRASRLLDMIEGFGMLPPPLETYQVTSMDGKSLGELPDVYEWEPEDEN